MSAEQGLSYATIISMWVYIVWRIISDRRASAGRKAQEREIRDMSIERAQMRVDIGALKADNEKVKEALSRSPFITFK